MARADRYKFRPAVMADLPLLRRWQALAHVAEWWGAEDAFDEDDLADPRIDQRIVSLGGTPLAFMQDYAVHGWEGGHHFDHLPPGSRGIDQFIGLPDMLGRGHGTALIAERVAALLAAGAPVIATDPHPDNARAIAVYTKLGFRPMGAAQDTPWGRILPMGLTAPAAPEAPSAPAA